MSYILDALKRADADRERGHVPGLHSQTAGLATAGPTGHPLANRFAAGPRPALLATAVLALLGTAGAVWWSRPAPEPVPVASHPTLNTPAAAPTPAVPARVESAPAAPTPPAPATALAPTTDTPPVRPAAPVLPILAPPAAPPVPAVSSTGPNTSAKAPEKAAANTATNALAQAPTRTDPGAGAPAAPGAALPAQPVAEPAPPTAGTTASPATAAVRRFADLPPETRAQLPPVNVSGSTYSQNPVHRMLIANGKVVQEGGEIAPGLTLETIGQRSAVLNHRGMRYSIGY